MKTVTFDLSQFSVTVKNKEGMSVQQILELAEKEAVKQLSNKFPHYRYGITDGESLILEDLKIGRPIRTKESKQLGLIHAIKPGTKYPIHVVLQNGQLMKYTVGALEKVNKRTSIDKLITGRPEWRKEMGNDWSERDTGYLKNNCELVPVVFGSCSRGTYKAIIVSHEADGSFYNLKANHLSKMSDKKTS